MPTQIEFKLSSKLVTVESLASVLGTSGATVRNWCKKYDFAISKGCILESDAEKLIQLNKNYKLSSRANKTHSETRKLHNELGSRAAKKYFEIYFLHLDPEQANDKLLAICDEFDFISRYNSSQCWESNSGFSRREELDLFLKCLNEDFLGFLYLSSRTDSEKNLDGKFYTPFELCIESLQYFFKFGAKTFIDPCCGAGAFLLAAYRVFGPKIHLIGNDIDTISLKLCEFNLRWFLDDHEWSLTNATYEDIALPRDNEDLVIGTNPPWSSQSVRGTEHSDLSVRVTEYFLSRLKSAQSCFVLPQSLFEVTKHNDFRLKISDEKKVVAVKHIGKPFKGLLTEVSILYATGNDIHLETPIAVSDAAGNSFSVDRKRIIRRNGKPSFFIGNSDEYSSLWNKLHSFPLLNLSDLAEFALGIVTGDNKRLILKTPTKDSEVCCVGKDILSMEALVPSAHIEFKPEQFQQCAPEQLLRAENQIIYRFIANQIICTPSNGDILCLNSANVIVLDKGLPNWLVASLLQTHISQTYNRLVFQSTKVLKNHLLQIPLPKLGEDSMSKIWNEYKTFKSGGISKSDYFKAVNRIVNGFFKLTDDETHLLVMS